MKHTIRFYLLLIVFSTSCISKSKMDKTISISGAFALYPVVVQWSEEYKKIHPEIRFNISGGGAGKGMADALTGTVDLGMFSREISEEEIEKGAWWTGLCIDAVVPTISDQNPCLATIKQEGMTRDEFRSIFIESRIPTWSCMYDNTRNYKISVYTRSDACGAAGTWARYLGGTQEDIIGIGVYGDPGLVQAVARDPNAIGFNNTIYVYDITTGLKRPGIEVIPIDINENGVIDPEEDFYPDFESIMEAIGDGRYPSPPARELYFISNGKPEKQAVLDFIKWCLTEGQEMVRAAGYIPLEDTKIEEYLQKID